MLEKKKIAIATNKPAANKTCSKIKKPTKKHHNMKITIILQTLSKWTKWTISVFCVQQNRHQTNVNRAINLFEF